MALSLYKKIEMEFGFGEDVVQAALPVIQGNIERMLRRLPRAAAEGRQQEIREICERLEAFAEAVEEPQLGEIAKDLAGLSGEDAGNRREARLQALDMLIAEWRFSDPRTGRPPG